MGWTVKRQTRNGNERDCKIPANTMIPKALSAITHIAGVLGTLGLLIRVWVTYRLAVRRKDTGTKK